MWLLLCVEWGEEIDSNDDCSIHTYTHTEKQIILQSTKQKCDYDRECATREGNVNRSNAANDTETGFF